MVWRNGWSLLYSRPNRIITIVPSVHYISSRTLCITYKPQKRVLENLTHHAVHSTLLNCRSDLIALSSFIWFAKQPKFSHDRLAYNHMVGVVRGIMEQCETVKGVVLELEKLGCDANAKTFMILLEIYWHGGMNGLVFEAFEQMNSHGFTPNTKARNVVMDVLFKTGYVDTAVRVLKETQAPNFLTLNIALRHLCNLKDLFLIGDVLRMMLKMGYYPNLETFEMAFNSFCKMGKLAEAYQVLGVMVAYGVPLSVNIWSILIDGFCRLCKHNIAFNLLEKMVEAGFSPTVVTYTILIKGFLKSHRVSDAFDILHKMESRGCPCDLDLCNVLIGGLAKLGRHDDAINVFIGLVNKNIAPDSCTVCTSLSAICMSRRFSLFPKLAGRHLIEADLKVCNSLLSYFIKAGFPSHGLIKVCNSLLNYFCKAGFPSCALNLYDDMINGGLTPDKYTFAGLLSGLCGSRKIDLAISVYRGIVRKYPCEDPYLHTIVFRGLVNVGRFHEAVGLFRKAVVDGQPLDVISYTDAINGLFKGGRSREACSLFNQMKKVGISPNTDTYNVMLSGLFKERDVETVKEMLQEMIDNKINLDCNNSLFSFLCRSYHYRSIIGLLVEMGDLGLMPAEAKRLLLYDYLGQGVKLEDESSSTLIYNVENGILVDTSGSEDLSDMVASVG